MKNLVLIGMLMVLVGCNVDNHTYGIGNGITESTPVSVDPLLEGSSMECIEWKNVSSEVYHESQIDEMCFDRECYFDCRGKEDFCVNQSRDWNKEECWTVFSNCKTECYRMLGNYRSIETKIYSLELNCTTQAYVENRTETVCNKEHLVRQIQ